MNTALGLSESATRQVVSAAGMAPSLFNTQPWRFRLCPDRIEVHADLGRRLIGHDPEDRELRIACGAALFNLRLALHAHGVTPVVTIEPGDLPEALAVIRRGPVTVQSRDDAALHQAITRRRTNRHPFLDAPMPEAYRRVLTYAAAAEGCGPAHDHQPRRSGSSCSASSPPPTNGNATMWSAAPNWMPGPGTATVTRMGCRWPRRDRNPNPGTVGLPGHG